AVGFSVDDKWSKLVRDFANPSTTITQSSNSHPQGPRQLSALHSCKSGAEAVRTPFELRVQEKMHAFATSAAQPDFHAKTAKLNVNPTYFANDHGTPYRTDKLAKPPNVLWKT